MKSRHIEKLVADAENGERLSTKDRRLAVSWMMQNRPEESNVALSEIFQVTERTIRDDKAFVRAEVAKQFRELDLGAVIGDIVYTFDTQIKDIEASKKKCDKGTRTYLEHCRAIFRLEMEKVEALQKLGYYPLNLGTLTEEKYEFRASVGVMVADGDRPGVAPPISAAAIDAEFSDVPLLPAHVDSTEESNGEK